MARIRMTQAKAKTLSDARDLALSSSDNFALLSALWSLCMEVSREQDWAPTNAVYNPFHRVVVDYPDWVGPLSEDQAEQLLYQPYRSPSVAS